MCWGTASPREHRYLAELLGARCVEVEKTMLRPPVTILGVPAIEKVTREIARWAEELGEEAAAIPQLAEIIRRNQLEGAVACFRLVADAKAYAELNKIAGPAGLPAAG